MAKKVVLQAKTTIAVPVPRPRNTLATAARQRAAGAHGPTRKAERVAARVRLNKSAGES
jgi:hypothetical protein